MTAPDKKLATNSAEIETEDLLLEIFLRLPINSIQRFVSVCKQWKSLLTNPTFRKQWRIHNLKPPTGLFLLTNEPLFVPFSPCSNTPTFPKIKNIDQSCNGLLLCSAGQKYTVYNPTTDTSFALPKLVIKPPRSRILTMILAFDPKRFGPHYKVVCRVVVRGRPDFPLIYVYSSSTRSWKSVSAEISRYSLYGDGVYWNGAIHWILGLYYFDIQNERFKRMPRPPPRCGDWRRHYYFGESCDRLNYAKSLGDNYRTSSVYLYELKRDFSEWVLKYNVSFNIEVYSMLYVVHGSKEDDDSFLVLKTAKGITRYNIVSETSEVLPVSLKGGYGGCAFQYIESQCSVC